MQGELVLIFETHATSLDNEAGLASGWYDADLSPSGIDQAHALGLRRRDDDLVRIFCSDLRRASRTAEIAFEPGGPPIERDVRLRECDYGTLTRVNVADIDARRAGSPETPFPGGESYADVARRVNTWLRDLRRTHERGSVLVIGHRATFYAFEHLLNGVPLAQVVSAEWRWQAGWTYRVQR